MDELEQVRNLENQLAQTKKAAAKALRTRRESLGLSLRQAGKKVRLGYVALFKIENGDSWRTETVARVVRTYEKLAA